MFPPLFTTLSLVHNAGVLHRGISPETIYVTDKGELKLTDFCISGVRTINTELKTEIFPGYAAPEQYSAASRQGTWTDVYGICAVLYRILTGSKPDPANIRLEGDNLYTPQELNPNIPKHVSDVIMDGMNILGEDRIPTITELVTRLFDQPAAGFSKTQTLSLSRNGIMESSQEMANNAPYDDYNQNDEYYDDDYDDYDDDDDDDEPEETENVVSEETFSNVENLKLDIGASEVQIKTGTDDKIHVDDSRMKTENAVQKRLSDDRKTLEITMKMRSSFDFKNVRNVKGILVIYLPRDYKFDQVDMEYGAVTAEIDGLNAKSLKIESGASGCTIKNADIEELDVETGAGSLDFYGTVEKEVDIDCGAGSVTLNLEGKVEDYNYELDSSAGSIEIGEDIDLGGLSTEKSIDNGSKRTIEISNGAGSVEIRFH